jgi:predicted DCC family thiol-disulfide oxidoreductase YuxK
MVVLFDGVCNLCSGAVQFIVRRDPKKQIRFSSLQSEYAARQLVHFGIGTGIPSSLVVIEKDKMLQKSDAVLEIARHLSGAWPVIYVLKVIPRFMRDAAYNWVAANRYRWWGKRSACWIATPDLQARFINS